MLASMNGERDLGTLLRTLRPILRDGAFVFCSFAGARYGDHAALDPIAAVSESEGLTLVIPASNAASAGLADQPTFRCITLQVHSSLEAVGLTAAVSTALARKAISANLVAGAFHDHVFVPADRAEDALDVLQALAAEAGTPRN